MFQIELCLAVDEPLDIVAVALYLPVVAAIAVALRAKGRHLLPAGDRTLEVSVRVQVPLRVHVLEADLVSAAHPLSRAAGRHTVRLLLFQGPQRVVVVVAVEARHDLLPAPRTVGELRGVQEEAKALIS